MKIKPLLDKVVIKDYQLNETTKSGIVLPSSAQEKPQMAIVVAVGTGGVINDQKVTMQVKKDDVILYSKYAGSEFKLDNNTYKILSQSDIMAIIEE